MDFRDSAARSRVPRAATIVAFVHAKEYSGSGDEYWARMADWHRALYESGFFGLSWPRDYGGQELAPVYDVIVDEELVRAGAPPRPSVGYLVYGIGRHGSDELRQALSARHHQWHRALVPGLQRARRRFGSGVADHHRHPRWRQLRGATDTRSGPATPTSRTGVCCWRAPTPRPNATAVCRRS